MTETETWVAWAYVGGANNTGTICPLEFEGLNLTWDIALKNVPRNRRTLDLPAGTSFLAAEAAFGINQPNKGE